MKSVFIIIGCLLFVACGGNAPLPATVDNVSEVAIAPDPEPEEIETSPPTLSLNGGEIEAANLPAVSKDGTRIAYLEQYEEGLSGLLTARLVVVDAANQKQVHASALLEDEDIDEVEPELPARLEKANAFLASHQWNPMTSVARNYRDFENCENFHPETDACVQTFTVGDLDIIYTEPNLTIAGKTTEVPDWSAKGYCSACSDDDGMPSDCPSDPEGALENCDVWCGAPAFVEMAAIHKEGRILLVKVAYSNSTDDCEDVSPTFHLHHLE